jgi:hypothetical protein
MGQILVFYMGFAVVICHFLRKFCQDDDEVDDEYNKRDNVRASGACTQDQADEKAW